MFGDLFRKKRPGLEQQLQDLVGAGVRLLPEATTGALMVEWSQKQFEERPYLLALVVLGGDDPPLSENIWHFDTECIEDHGAYVRIAEHFRDLAQGDLPLVEIEDYVDVEESVAWLAFKLDGTEHRWTCEIDDDWVDPTIISRFVELLSRRGTTRRFTYLDEGQACIIGYFNPDELSRLRKVTGLDWKWLT